MKLRQRVMSMLLTVAMIIGLAPVLTGQAKAATSGTWTCWENLAWSFSDGTLSISKIEGAFSHDENYCPPWVEFKYEIKKVSIGYGVTCIGGNYFCGYSNLTSVNIPNSVTSIKNSAFEDCSSLTSINIPNSVTSIESSAFSGCSSLISVNIPDSVIINGGINFSGCSSLTSVNIPDSVTIDGGMDFSGCSSLTSVNIPDSGTINGSVSFSDCSSLISVNIPDSLTIDGFISFFGCSSLTSVNIPDSVTINEGISFSGCSSLTSVNIPDSVTINGGISFFGCSSLTGVNIPDSVTINEGISFSGCSSLTSVNIPDSMTVNGDIDFSGCSSLTSVNIPDSVTINGNISFSDCSSLTSANIPESVTSIKDFAFCGCSSMTYIGIPDSITSIGDYCFINCKSLDSINIPDSVTSIGEGAFCDCSNLGTIDIPNSVTSIGSHCFMNCESLTSINVSDSATSIGEDVFYGCESLTSINIPASVTTIGREAFGWCLKLSSVYFSGDAPSVTENSSEYASFPSDTTLYYIPGKSGWTTPTWEGYKTATWEGKDPSGGIDSNGSKLYIKTRTPHVSFVSKNGNLSMTFNTNVRKGTGSIHFLGGSNSVSQYDLPVSESCVQVNGDTVTIALANLPLTKGGGYSVTIDSGAFVSDPDGIPFYGLKNRTAWLFAIYVDTLASDGIDLKWETSGLLWWQKEDRSKPAIPNGTKEQYANALQSWAKRMGVSSITASNARELLDKPVYLPLKDTNGSMAQMFDKGTTVQQVMEDIVFLEQLKPYAQKLDAELKNVSPSSKLMFRFDQEAKAYKMAVSWYSQVNRYFEGRDEDSNFFLSIGAPLAYKTILKELSNAAGPYSKYVSPMLKSVFSGSELDSLKSLSGEKDYGTFKDSVAGLSDRTSLLNGIYSAFAEGEYGGLIKFGANALMDSFGKSDNAMLKDISQAWTEFSSVKSAVTLSLATGSTIGMFPLVVDFYKGEIKKVSDQVQAFYFIGDYYIQDKYPELYDLVYDSKSYFAKDPASIDWVSVQALADSYNDTLVKNWYSLLYDGVIHNKASHCREIRYDLTNYALLLRFAKTMDINQVKEMLVRYLDAELHEGATTGIYAKCPVTVEIYDKNGNKVASLSSKDDEIASCEYGTLYLLGENNETKYFLLNDNTYTAKIIPYDTGKMDVMIVETAEDGTQDSRLYENVSVKEGLTFQTATGTEDKTLYVTGSEESEIKPEETIPVTGVSLSGPKELALGETAQMTGAVCPSMATDKALTWASSDTSVITVDQTGEITAQGVGSAEITATATNEMTKSVTVQVYQPAESISADVEGLTMVAGESNTLEVTVLPENTTHSISWSSSDPSVAVVDEAGVIQALSEGETMLTATCDGVSRGIALTVYDDLLHLELYQSDTEGDRVRVDMKNCSLSQTMDGTLYLAFYDGEKMLTTRSCQVSLKSGDTETIYLPMSRVPDNARYTVKAFLLGTDNVPIQVCKESVVIGKMTG